jgi:hypothetical protein
MASIRHFLERRWLEPGHPAVMAARELEAALETSAALRKAVGISDEQAEAANREKIRRSNVGLAWDVAGAFGRIEQVEQRIEEATTAAAKGR